MRCEPSPTRSRTRGQRTPTGPMPVMISRSGKWPWRTSRLRPSSVVSSAYLLSKVATSASTACASSARAPLRNTSVSGSAKFPGWESWKTLVSVHGVSLLCWRSGGVEHPHDTPPYPFMPSPTSAHSSPRALPQRSAARSGVLKKPDNTPKHQSASRCATCGFMHRSKQHAHSITSFEEGLSPQAASGANTGFAGMSSALGLVATGSAGAANDREEIMAVVDPRIAGKPVPRISKETMEHECVARVNNVKALDVAFLDQRIPRYERDIINMVGMGVTENAALTPNVKEGAVAFSVTYVRAKSGKGAALHRHATEEVFIPVKGRWQIFWLEGEEERSIDLDEGDVVNVPIGVYRGFRSLTDAHDALLMAIIGGPDAGKVDWHPSVLAEARKTGLSVDDAGNLIIERPAA